jgi:hypothetical protein
VKVPTCGGQFFAQAGHTSHFIQWRCPPVEDTSLHRHVTANIPASKGAYCAPEDSYLHRQVTPYILFSESAHLWRTVICSGRSQL